MKLNFKIVGLHFLAAVLVIAAFRQYSVLYDLELLKVLDGQKMFENMAGSRGGTLGERLTSSLYLKFILTYVGLGLTFLTSLFITLRKKEHWANSVLVLLLVFSLILLNFYYAESVRAVLFFPARAFMSFSISNVYLLNASILLSVGIGIYLLSFKWTSKTV